MQQELLQPLPVHSGLSPELPTRSGFRASQGSFECLACSRKAASAFSGAPETSHWCPKHITAGRFHLMPIGPTLTWHNPKGEVNLVTLPVFSLASHTPHPQYPGRFETSCLEMNRTSNNWLSSQSHNLQIGFLLTLPDQTVTSTTSTLVWQL